VTTEQRDRRQRQRAGEREQHGVALSVLQRWHSDQAEKAGVVRTLNPYTYVIYIYMYCLFYMLPLAKVSLERTMGTFTLFGEKAALPTWFASTGDLQRYRNTFFGTK
jgi:phosphoenolpyruvate synthase/pyruvate phosphate dikinase